MPPKHPNIARLEKGRGSRLNLPSDLCPTWFSKGVEVYFLPLFWKEEVLLSPTRLLEALLICSTNEPANPDEWEVSLANLIQELQSADKPERLRAGSLIYRSRLDQHNREWRLKCPPLVKGLCDEARRIYVTDHSLGVCIWSREAFNEHYSALT